MATEAAAAAATPDAAPWALKFEKAFMDLDCQRLTAVTFFKVPAQLMACSPSDFQPRVLRLGLHNLDLDFTSATQVLKMALARELMSLKNLSTVEEWREMASRVVADPKQLRHQFGVDADDSEITNLLFLDALFVVVYLQASLGRYASDGIRRLVWSPSFARDLIQMETDMFLLENQIPISLVKVVLAELLLSEREQELELNALLKHAVRMAYPFVRPDLDAHLDLYFSGPASALQNCQHILDCLYHVSGHIRIDPPLAAEAPKTASRHHLTAIQRREAVASSDRSPSATSLRNLGVGFSGTDPTGNALTVRDVQLTKPGTFRGRTVMMLPQVAMFDGTAALLRNLAAHEQLAHPAQVQVRGYLSLMSDLASSAEDAKLLGERGVIKSHLGSYEQVAAAWNRMCESVEGPHLDEHWTQVLNDILVYRKSNIHVWRAEIRAAVCAKPTLFFSFLIAALLLVLTLVQTYCSIVSSPGLAPKFPWYAAATNST